MGKHQSGWRTFGVLLVAVLVGVSALAATAGTSFAIPSLQLDILGGVYDPITQTIVATADSFTLFAYLIPDSKTPLAGTYLLSAAVVPKTGPAGASLGSFDFGASTIDVTADMTYGVPPLEALVAHDPGDLSEHGIFETFFAEFSFTFAAGSKAIAYDTQATPGVGPTASPAGTMYFKAFTLDVTDLDPSISIHFDLYSAELGDGPPDALDRDQFAPFSHDAQSGPGGGGGGGGGLPAPATLILLGLGFVGFWGLRRLRARGN
jgi:hypothetical protein